MDSVRISSISWVNSRSTRYDAFLHSPWAISDSPSCCAAASSVRIAASSSGTTHFIDFSALASRVDKTLCLLSERWISLLKVYCRFFAEIHCYEWKVWSSCLAFKQVLELSLFFLATDILSIEPEAPRLKFFCSSHLLFDPLFLLLVNCVHALRLPC